MMRRAHQPTTDGCTNGMAWLGSERRQPSEKWGRISCTSKEIGYTRGGTTPNPRTQGLVAKRSPKSDLMADMFAGIVDMEARGWSLVRDGAQWYFGKVSGKEEAPKLQQGYWRTAGEALANLGKRKLER